jgi:thiamine biosynthesis lipoprotein ApbE
MAHASGDLPVHLNNHHLDTLSVILAHPVSHNIRWVDVLSLLEAAGEVEEHHDGKFKVTIGGETEFFERPRHKDIDTQMVVDLRRMFQRAGFDGRPAGQEI